MNLLIINEQFINGFNILLIVSNQTVNWDKITTQWRKDLELMY